MLQHLACSGMSGVLLVGGKCYDDRKAASVAIFPAMREKAICITASANTHNFYLFWWHFGHKQLIAISFLEIEAQTGFIWQYLCTKDC